MQTLSIYEPILEELNQVEKRLSQVSDVSFPFLSQLLDHVLDVPGKRIRPAVTLLASKLYPNDNGLPNIMATAVELLHIATLIHDDTVDNSDIRRGKTTVSSLWGRNIAVLLGDYVFATSATFVCDTSNVRVIRRFSETIMELSSGELFELTSAFNWRLTREQYWERIYNKTASLFTTAAESGALLSDSPEASAQALKTYGYNLGMAFQIVDDILDFEGLQAEAGKPVGNDLLQGTLTLPAILLVERYPDNNPIPLLFEEPDKREHLIKAQEMILNSSIIRDSYAIARDFGDKALQALEGLPELQARRSLGELVSYAIDRRS